MHPSTQKKFEARPIKWLILHILSCILGGAVAYGLLTTVTHNQELNHVCTIVAAINTSLAFVVNATLMELAQRNVEAIVWRMALSTNITVLELSERSADITSAWNAIKLLSMRWHLKVGSTGRYIVLFLMCFTATQTLSFALGRAVKINAWSSPQLTRPETSLVEVAADLNERDISNAKMRDATDGTIRGWDFLPPGQQLPSVVSLQPPESPDSGHKVWFSEVQEIQFVQGGRGLGTFDIDYTPEDRDPISRFDRSPRKFDPMNLVPSRSLLYERWGMSVRCVRLTSMHHTRIYGPAGGDSKTFTKVVVPIEFITELFEKHSLTIPSDISVYTNENEAAVGEPPAYIQYWDSPNHDGSTSDRDSVFHIALQTFTRGMNLSDATSQRWGFLRAVLVRLNQDFAPNNQFLRTFSLPDGSPIGLDAAACLEILQPYNVILRNESSILAISGISQHPSERTLTTDQKETVFNVLNQRLEDSLYHLQGSSVVHEDWVPSKFLVALTNGTGINGYTSLEPSHVEELLGKYVASNILPFLEGSGHLSATVFLDTWRADTFVNIPIFIGILAVPLILGIIAGCFIPTLPAGIPQRHTDLVSYLTFIYGEGINNFHSFYLKTGPSLDQARNHLKGVKVYQYRMGQEGDRLVRP